MDHNRWTLVLSACVYACSLPERDLSLRSDDSDGGTNSVAGSTTKGGAKGSGGSGQGALGGQTAPSSGGTAVAGNDGIGASHGGRGNTLAGGTTSLGGTNASSGASSTSSGGHAEDGGSISSGAAGSPATGGVTAAGGLGSGGSSLGSTSSGGASTGTGVGGVSTGGTVTGAAGSTLGGAPSAGAPSGGASGLSGNSGLGGSTPSCTNAPGHAFVPVTNSCSGTLLQCQGESCCTAITLASGTFPMGRGNDDAHAAGSSNELPEHAATLSTFALDRYEVTVGRFRKFVESYDDWHGTRKYPAAGTGANPNAAGTGWNTDWSLPETAALLRSSIKCGDTTWTDLSGNNESCAMNCVGWSEAFAFCIWDGGRLPTEAEWEYVAAGGALNHLYAWGNESPTAYRALYNAAASSPFTPVGSKRDTGGAGCFGHLDLAGSMSEWAFDVYAEDYYTRSNPCDDCVNTGPGSYRISRGGAWDAPVEYIRSAFRGFYMGRGGGMGLRCARAAQ